MNQKEIAKGKIPTAPFGHCVIGASAAQVVTYINRNPWYAHGPMRPLTDQGYQMKRADSREFLEIYGGEAPPWDTGHWRFLEGNEASFEFHVQCWCRKRTERESGGRKYHKIGFRANACTFIGQNLWQTHGPDRETLEEALKDLDDFFKVQEEYDYRREQAEKEKKWGWDGWVSARPINKAWDYQF